MRDSNVGPNRQSQEELTLRDAAVAHLEQELSCVRSTMNELRLSSLKAVDDQALKCMVMLESLFLEWILMDNDFGSSNHRILTQIACVKEDMNSAMQLLK